MIKIDEVFEFSNNDTIVIGCSSGPDSMSLVDMLLKVRDKYNLQLVVAHVNHNVRKESYEEAEYLKQYCVDNNLDVDNEEYILKYHKLHRYKYNLLYNLNVMRFHQLHIYYQFLV